jgi:energy-coupling factor transporter transmembrane protein EcfT
MEKSEKYNKAKERVTQLKGFYSHLAAYVVINSFILVNIFIRNQARGETFWQWPTFVTLFFWGIGLLFHAWHTFGTNVFLSKQWEQKQIEKYVEKDRKESEKYLR